MAAEWPEEIYQELVAAGVRQVAYVPDAGHRRLIDRCHADASMQAMSLTSEEEGVGMLAGAWLGGQRGVLLMQSSGVGNCINMLSLNQECRIPLLMLITMRGDWGEFNSWQVAMGQGTPAALEAANVLVYRADSEEHCRRDGARLRCARFQLGAGRGRADRPARGRDQGLQVRGVQVNGASDRASDETPSPLRERLHDAHATNRLP